MLLLAHRLCRLTLGALVAVAVSLTFGVSARAGDVTYTFSGVGNGTIDGTAWSGDFVFVFTGLTSNITSGGGEFRQDGIGGTFSEDGFSALLNADNAVVVNNDPSTPRIGFFNNTFDNGGTIQDSSLTAYHLATAFGPITGTGANLLPTFNDLGHGFDTAGGQNVELLGITSLTFTASVPEPSSLVLAVVGLGAGTALFLRRRKTS